MVWRWHFLLGPGLIKSLSLSLIRLGYPATGGIASYSMWGLVGAALIRAPWICGRFFLQHFPKKIRRLDLEQGAGEQVYVVGCWSNLVYFKQVRTTWILFREALCHIAFSHWSFTTLLGHMVWLKPQLRGISQKLHWYFQIFFCTVLMLQQWIDFRSKTCASCLGFVFRVSYQ